MPSHASHSITSCSAVVSGTSVNRLLDICTGDGRSIVSGNMVIPIGGTVTTYTPTDEHGAHMVAGSTVGIYGSTANFGNTNITGTVMLGQDAVIVELGSERGDNHTIKMSSVSCK